MTQAFIRPQWNTASAVHRFRGFARRQWPAFPEKLTAAQYRPDDLHHEFAYTAPVFGADVTAYHAIHDDGRREIFARLTGREPAFLRWFVLIPTHANAEAA